VIGTGIIGSLATFPLIMVFGLDRDFFWVLAPAFLVSTMIGSAVSWFLLRQLEEKGVLKQFNI
jgi:energy coupling factor transporter S component ThiW